MYSFANLMLLLSPSNITFYGYRKAKPKTTVMYFDRNDQKVERLEKELYNLTGTNIDNHVLFEVKTSEEHSVVLYFSDNRMFLGMGVKELN